MIDTKKLARIHAMKKEAELSDESYRDLLAGAAGVSSAKYIDTKEQYYAVIRGMQNYMIAIGKQPKGRMPNALFVDAVMRRAHKILGPSYRVRLSGFLEKIGKDALEECDPRELRRVMGFLSTLEREQNRSAS